MRGSGFSDIGGAWVEFEVHSKEVQDLMQKL